MDNRLLHQPLPTRWLETDNRDKLQALDKSGLKVYVENAESIRPVLARVLSLVQKFWENFENNSSTVLGYRISVAQQDISRATGLRNEGCTVGSWFENRKSIVEKIGKVGLKAKREGRLKDLCGVETKCAHIPVDMIKDDTTRYVASLVMEHLAGLPTCSNCSHELLDAIQGGMNGNVTKWPAYITKRMKRFKNRSFISCFEGFRLPLPYAVVIALLVREQAPDLWQQAVENEGQDIELLKKRSSNQITGWQDIELKKRRMNEVDGWLDIEEGRTNKFNGNWFGIGNLKGEEKIVDVEGDQCGEKRPKLLALIDLEEDRGSEDGKGVQMQEIVERKEEGRSEYNKGGWMQDLVEGKEWGSEDDKGGQVHEVVEKKEKWGTEVNKGGQMQEVVERKGKCGSEHKREVQTQDKVERKDEGVIALDYEAAGAILRRIKAMLAEECAETAEQYLLNSEGWIKASVSEVLDRELLEQCYTDVNFRSGDHVLENRMHGIPMRLSRRCSGTAELGQRNRGEKRNRRKMTVGGKRYDKLLVISVEHVLAHFVHKSKVPFTQGDLYVDPYIVFTHPHACRFLSACLSVFKVVLWSEKPREVHDLVLQHILGGIPSSDQILSYSIEDCTITRINREGNTFHGCYKDLTCVWKNLGSYGKKNTLLIDTSHVAMLRNKDGNVICPIPYQYHVEASHWQLETFLLPYLIRLESVQGIPKYVKDNAFGLEKGYSWQRFQFEGGRVTPLFATPCPSHCLEITKNLKMFPSASNSQLPLFNTQCPGISNTGQQFPITKTGVSISQSVSPAANLGTFEVYHGNSSRVSPGFNDHRQNDNMYYMRELSGQSDGNIKDTRELNLVKTDLQNMANEKDKLEKKLQEKDDVLQKVVDALEKVNEEKRIAEDENSDLSRAFVERDRALKQVKLEKTLGMKQKEKIICSLQQTVQALQENLGSFKQKQREFQILVKREVEKETAQIRSTLTDVLGLKQGEDLVVGAQKQVEELRQQRKVKHQLKPDQFMLVTSSDAELSLEEHYQQSNNEGTSSHMNGYKRKDAISHLLLTSDTEVLHCSICMEEWTTAGDHRICSLACGHMFGMSCIRKWLQQHEDNIGKCPQCNDKAKLSDIRILYVPVIAVTCLRQ